MLLIVLSFVIFYFFSVATSGMEKNRERGLLMITCIALAVMAGSRSLRWADTGVYVISFLDYTPSLSDLTSYDAPYGYGEMGFYYLGVLVKTFTTSSTAYLTIIALLSFLFLYIAFDKYCYYPMLGVCAYIARFYFTRNFIQIRAGLAYAIILVAVQYITQRDWKRYFALVAVAYCFHHSALIAVPLYFLSMIDIKKKHIIIGIVISFFIAAFYSPLVMQIVGDNASDLNVQTYVTEEYQREYGLLNPMIYFQLFLLFMYTYTEKSMKYTTPHYYTIRTAYFYSTMILITFSAYTALSGRTSSMFATLEMVIIPSLTYAFLPRQRWMAFMAVGVVLTTIFALTYLKMI